MGKAGNLSGTAATVVLAVIFAFVATQALLTPAAPRRSPAQPPQDQPCRGDPISVKYPYGGDFLQPHECVVQCDERRTRYILYANGKATQCETLPGCSDWGEDNGITCIPP